MHRPPTPEMEIARTTHAALVYSMACLDDLYQLGSMAITDDEIQELCQHILTRVRRIIQAPAGCFLLYHASELLLVPIASQGKQCSCGLIANELSSLYTQHGADETINTLEIAGQSVVTITLSHNATLLGIIVLAYNVQQNSLAEQHLLLTCMGKSAALLLHIYTTSKRVQQETVQQERQRIARDLHDGPAQEITFVQHKLEYSQRLLQKQEWQGALAAIEQARRILDSSLHNLRDSLTMLYAEEIEKPHFIESVQAHLQAYQCEHPEITLIYTQTELANLAHVPPGSEQAIFHFLQEALANIWQHAQATQATIRVCELSGRLSIEIGDNGTGLRQEQRNQSRQRAEREHFGLRIMRERIQASGGKWELHSQAGNGTVVRASFRLAESKDTEPPQ